MSKKSECLAWLIRRHGIEMTHLSGGSHIGSVLSAADIIAVLYADIMRYKSEDPEWDGRDRFIMSKGHAGAAVYAALAECGFFDTAELKTHYADGSRLSGHVSHHLPGVEFSTGSLGHGLSVAAGMALAAKQDGKLHRVFAVLGDGECDEGSVWEAALIIITCRALILAKKHWNLRISEQSGAHLGGMLSNSTDMIMMHFKLHSEIRIIRRTNLRR